MVPDPFTAIHLDCLGSNVQSYVQSIDKLIRYTSDRCQTATSAHTAVAPVTAPANSAKIEQFIALVGLARPAPFNVAALLALVDDSVENAVALYFDAGGDIAGLVGPAPSDVPVSSSDVMLSCGHVEANLSVQSLQQLKTALELIRAGAVPPSHVDGEYGEYTVENFTIMLPMKHAHQH